MSSKTTNSPPPKPVPLSPLAIVHRAITAAAQKAASNDVRDALLHVAREIKAAAPQDVA